MGKGIKRVVVRCEKCGAVHDGWLDDFCYACGGSLPNMCTGCADREGSPCNASWSFCVYCGTKLEGRTEMKA